VPCHLRRELRHQPARTRPPKSNGTGGPIRVRCRQGDRTIEPLIATLGVWARFEGDSMSKIGRLKSSLVVFTLLLGACSTSATTGPAPVAPLLPTAPPVRDLQQVDPVIVDDGLHRIVVTVPAAADEVSSTSEIGDVTSPSVDSETEPQTAEPNPGSDAISADISTLTPELLAQVPAGASLAAVGGLVGYRTSDGTFVPLAMPAESPEQAATVGAAPLDLTDPADSGRPFDEADPAAWLASVDGVLAVSRITDTSYAVTTSSLAPLEALAVHVAPDAPFALTADPYEPYQWALDNDGLSLSAIASISPPNQITDADVDGIEARSVANGQGVVVAVIDSGVDFGHRDLAQAAWVNSGEDCGRRQGNGVDDDGNGFIDDCNGWDFGDDDETLFVAGSSDHGTHVAGIIAADERNGFGVSGMAPRSRIMDLKVDDARGAISASAIARSIRYAVDNGADVVNLSLGSQPGAPIESVAVIAEAVEYAGQEGVLLVVAAGNNGQSLDSSPVYPASFNAANMLVVAASGPSDLVASFSNTGAAVDLMAPGELILSTVGGDELAFMSGTSQAAPMVAAAAAQVLELRGDASPSAVIEQLLTTADDVDANGTHPPRLNSARALGIEADDAAGGTVAIRNLIADDAGRVDAEILFPDVEGQFNQPFHWEASLVSLIEGTPFAITDHPVTTGVNTELIAAATNSRGSVMLAGADVESASFSTDLPSGVYALLIEAIPRTDSTVRLGDAYVAVFTVGDASHEVDASDAADDTSADPEADPGTVGQGSSDADADADESGQPTGSSDTDTTEPSAAAGDGGDAGSNGSPPDDDSGSGQPSDSGASTATTSLDSSVPADNGDGQADPSAGDDGPVDDRADGEENASDTSDPVAGGGSTPGRPGDAGSAGGSADGAGAGDDTATASDGPIEVGIDAAADGQWSVTAIAPQTGLIDEEVLVQISGTFPDEPTVWFGNQPADTIAGNDQLIVVRTRRHLEPETVDVSLRTRADGVVLEISDGFAFLRPGDDRPVVQTSGDTSPPATTAITSAGSNTDPVRGEDPGFELEPDEVVVAAPPATQGTNGRPGRGGDDDKSRNRQARAEITGPATTLPNGLSGVPLSGLDLIGGVPACNEPLCRTRRV
jgi:hypothetical protein